MEVERESNGINHDDPKVLLTPMQASTSSADNAPTITTSLPLNRDESNAEDEEESNKDDGPSMSPCKMDLADLPTKRPSPWRQPRDKLPPPVRTASTQDLATTAASSIEKSKSSNIGRKVKKMKKEKRQKRLDHMYRHLLFRDSFQMQIPLSVTADLGTAMQRSSEKRIQTIYKRFPAIRKEMTAKESESAGNSSNAEDEVVASNKEKGDLTASSTHSASNNSKKTKPLPKLKHVPKPQDYASVLDYLEAKYAQGIMIDYNEMKQDSAHSRERNQKKNEVGNDLGDDDEDDGGGSVYSESSFLDDTALQRTVAEQVLGQATTTKLELMDENDDDFFVNVGDLEVEETELTQQNYDPLNDTDKDKKEKRKKYAKKASAESMDGCSSSSKEKKKKDTITLITKSTKTKIDKGKDLASTAKKAPSPSKTKSLEEESLQSVQPQKKKLKTEESEKSVKSTSAAKSIKTEDLGLSHKSPYSSTASSAQVASSEPVKIRKKPGKKPLSDHAKNLLKKSRLCKKKMEALYQKIVDYIQKAPSEEMPRRATPKKKLRVELKCPPDKKTGDMITFTNPHVPGQKLRVKIPANRAPNGNFKVTVPIPAPNEPESAPNPDGEDVDYNRLSRRFYDLLEDYTRAYDDWCDAEGEFRKVMGDMDYTPHFEKRKKFDQLVNEFPNSELKSPVDKPYLQKILRRARQNKHKRDKNLAKIAQETTVSSSVKVSTKKPAKPNQKPKHQKPQDSDDSDSDSNDDDDDNDKKRHNDDSEDDSSSNSEDNDKSQDDSEDDDDEEKSPRKQLNKKRKVEGKALSPLIKKPKVVTQTIVVPQFSTLFPIRQFETKRFATF